MKYRTQYERPDRDLFRTNPGREDYEVYTVGEDGSPVVSGMNNRYAEVQCHRESVDLPILLQRYAAGDESALNQRIGDYMDVTNAPSSYAEFLDGFKKIESDFYSLPEGFRELFNNSTVEYWQSVGTDEFHEKVDKFMASLKKEKPGNADINNSDNNNNSPGGTGGNINEPKSKQSFQSKS